MKRGFWLLIAIGLAVAYQTGRLDFLLAYLPHSSSEQMPGDVQSNAQGNQKANRAIWAAYQSRSEDVFVSGIAQVTRILPDDTKGSRHQRFIISIGNGVTVLVAHNIDISPRLAGLKAGDWVDYGGDYIYNGKGGVLHWTHPDPRGQHRDGWLEAVGVISR